MIKNSQAIVYTLEAGSVPATSTADFSATITMPTTGTAKVRKHAPHHKSTGLVAHARGRSMHRGPSH